MFGADVCYQVIYWVPWEVRPTLDLMLITIIRSRNGVRRGGGMYLSMLRCRSRSRRSAPVNVATRN